MTKQAKAGGSKSRSKFAVSPEEFVTAWNSSETAQEAADRLGMPKPIALARASKYRKAGVKLKQMRRGAGRGLDVEGLNRLIAELEAGKKRAAPPTAVRKKGES